MVQVQNIKISIVIPCLNEAGFLEKTIKNCLKLQGNFEIIIVDGGSNDDTLAIAQEFKNVKIFQANKGRAAQMNYAAKKATGEVLLFLHADTFLPKNTYNLITKQLQKPEYIGGSFRLRIDKSHPFLNFYTWCTQFSLELFTYGDNAFFVKNEVFKAIGGFKTISFMEDVEIQKRLRQKGKFKKLKGYVLTSGRRFEKNGTIRQLLKDVSFVLFYNLSIPPHKLKRFYKDH